MAVSTIETAVEEYYGAHQTIQGLQNDFAFYGDGTDGGALFHSTCQRTIAYFGEGTTPEAITQAAHDHWCPRLGGGVGVE